MPLPDNIKVVPLGNFHDNMQNLPAFLQGYLSPNDTGFSTTLGFNTATISKGSNMIIRGGANTVDDGTADLPANSSIFFDSYSHVVMKLNATSGRYEFDAIYRSSRGGIARLIDINLETETNYTSLKALRKPINRNKITQVFTTQLSSCALQTVFIGSSFIGSEVNNPKFILFSHLQNKSVLNSILNDLQWRTALILKPFGCINLCFPTLGGVLDCYYGNTENQEFISNSITFLRDLYLWPENTTQSGYGVPLIGYIIGADNSIRHATTVGASPPFGAATMMNLSRFPIFNSTSPEMRESIKRARIYKNSWISTKPKDFEDVIDYYYSLFKRGCFGDAYFISQFLRGSENPSVKETVMINYNPKGTDKLKFFFNYSSGLNVTKNILWQQALPIGTVINQIRAFKATNFRDFYIDLAYDQVEEENAHRSSAKLSIK